MKISVITPSFRGSEWLKLCIASVADQNIEHEHIVQDSCSDDGTQGWLPHDKRVSAYIEKDNGMYDAVNRGLRKASGEILCYLNCDEQYLPGTLEKVRQWFAHHPHHEVLFGDAIVVSKTGDYLCDRRIQYPEKYHTLVSGNLSVFTSSTFFRRSVIENRGIFFDPNLKDIGDAEWVLRLLQHKVPIGTLPEFLSAFTDTGENMNIRPNALKEKAEAYASAPLWARRLKPLILALYRGKRFLSGVYFPRPHSYAIHTKDSPDVRKEFMVSKPTFRWPGR